MKAKLQGGDEWDAFSRSARRVLLWRPGALKKIKRGFNKRFRKQAKQSIKSGGD